ncbi:MAG: methylcrotonyl-CoA carboxylase subunit alpha [Anaerolineales bacterium]
MQKILIANRGEIALRLIRACRALGIRSVAVYSSADKNSPHTRLADEAIAIGGAAPKDSYLNLEAILRAAQQSGAQAIHPGYGFLSENADFAEAVAAAGLIFIGPPPAAIRAMGDKAEAKRRMKAAGVPTLPGLEEILSPEQALSAAAEIGYPLLVKASAGGGGRGMRIVQRPEEMAESLASARREAQNAFGDPRLLLEKYIENGHHVEIQVFGDQHGQLVQLFERECSVQRRHQKIIEESPSPLLTPETRAAMGQAAVQAARAVGYFSAGTVEFIYEPASARFYFLEMNTRLQVEHPVTEAVTGLDLAQWQIRVAAGEKFPHQQAELQQRGHAIECRVYAEDENFLPSAGRLLKVIPPPNARVDSGVESGGEVSPFYDSMLAKIIVHAETRPAAIEKMRAALAQTVIHGVQTNLNFLQALLARPEFARGEIHSAWVEKEFHWKTPPAPPELWKMASLALAAPAAGSSSPTPSDPWQNPGGFRLGAPAAFSLPKDWRRAITVSQESGRTWVSWQGITWALENQFSSAAGDTSSGDLRAPMPGAIRAVLIQPGENVQKGQTLLLLEAMKMELKICAPFAGQVESLSAALGQSVERGQSLVKMKEGEERRR